MPTLSLKRQTAFTKKDHSKLQVLLRLLFFVILIMVLCLFYIWSRVEVVKMGYQIGELQKEQKELQAESQKLKLELSIRNAPERIESLAVNKLKMIWPKPEHVLKINRPKAGL